MIHNCKEVSIENSVLESPTLDLTNNVSFSVYDVYQGLSALHSVWSVGPDGLCGEFLFQNRHIILYSLWNFFRCSFDEGILPFLLIISFITPILKSGCHSIISNYRPISVKSHVTKIFETIVLNFIHRPLNKIIIEEQHCFRPDHSTTNCNLVICNFVYESF